MFEKHGDEGALPGLQLLPSTVDRAFDQGGGRQCVRCHFREVNLDAIGDALDFFDDSIGQGERLLPEPLELLFDSLHALD